VFTLRIEIPALPPSVNRYVRQGKGHTYLTKESKEFMKLASTLAREQARSLNWEIIPATNFFPMWIFFEMKHRRFPDPNNLLKVLIDAMEGIIFENDKWVCPIVRAEITGRFHTTVEFQEWRGKD